MLIAVTGVGAVTALGHDSTTTFEALCAGRTGLVQPALDWPNKGPVGAIQPERRRTSSELAVQAAREAIGDLEDRSRLAVIGASTSGDMALGEQAFAADLRDEVLADPGHFLWVQLCHRPTGQVAADLDAGGPSMTLSTACTSGTCALGAAADLLRAGQAAQALVVGSDALCDITLAGFGTLGVYSPMPTAPFDADRAGMNIGEGAGALLLEPLEAALARGARPLAILAGYADTSDAHHLSAPHPEGEGARRAIREALGDVSAQDVGYVNAHATGTQLNDAMEAIAIAAELPQAAVSGSKGALGHTLGAAGAIEAVITVLALKHGRLPPNTGCRNPAFVDLDLLATEREVKISAAVSVNFAFGGNNAVALFTAWES
ncbi:MAG: beta-ketoacyl-[acyl-carrier-protein] synthase family protein [Proteobacteria bacterium]|nr:beta-ketoacyl-[acyl-carrier-protein] synthase family protein [Pseudomonadota bacterium]MCP4915630.1 beta-ketoacyl-[acyl-carrier-protein] synthase family protein [Pseudomonadota bacterium]